MATTPTRAQIEAAPKTITGVPAAMLLSLIRQSDIYRAQPDSYPNLEATIVGFNDTVKAQQLNAALALIDDLGSGEVELKGDVEFSLPRERDALVGYCISVLYDVPIDSMFGFRRRTSQSIPAPSRW